LPATLVVMPRPRLPLIEPEREPERVTDGTIIVAGLIAGALVAFASLFWTLPERIVRTSTGVGEPPPPTIEERAGQALGQRDPAVALDLFRQSVAEHPGSMIRLSALACALAVTGDTPGAVRVLTERIGPDDSETALAFAAGEVGPSDQRLDYMEGRWRVTGAG